MSIPVYNVPNAPGIPPMVRSALTGISTVQGLVAGVQQTIQFFQGRPPLPTWGIYDANFKSVVSADSFMSFMNKKEANIPTFQVQDGKLSSYNKVQLPFTNSVRITKSGTEADRQALLRQLDTLQASLDNVIIVTPERSYLNVNCPTYEVTRKDVGDAYMFTDVELYFQEVPTTSAVYTTTNSADTTNAQQASAQPPANQGVVQPAAPSNGAQTQATTVLAGGVP